MYLKRLLAFLKSHLKYLSIFVVTILLASCDSFPVSNEKPVFTISNMPSVEQEESSQVNDVQAKMQREKTRLSKDKQDGPVSEPMKTEPVKPRPTINQALSLETNQINTNFNNAEATEKTKIAKTSEENGSVPENISQENIPEKSNDENQYNTAQNTDLVETDLEPQVEAPLLPEPLNSTEIASLIIMPPSIYTPPPFERIKFYSLLNTNDRMLKSIMGVPSFVLENGQMKLWQYDVGKCIIDFFLYQKVHDYIVTFIDIRGKMLGDTTNEQACESELNRALNS